MSPDRMSPDDSYAGFLVHSQDGVGTITIDRAGKRKALTADMWRRLAAICADLAADPELCAVVLTGSSPSFCAGADIGSLSEDGATMRAVVETAEQALRSLPVPTVAKIRGHCMGGGSQLAVACDLRIADSTAMFAVPPARLGAVYPVHSTRPLIELVGAAQAKRLLFTAESIDAVEAVPDRARRAGGATGPAGRERFRPRRDNGGALADDPGRGQGAG